MNTESKIFCGQCGSETLISSNFCYKCGAKLVFEVDDENANTQKNNDPLKKSVLKETTSNNSVQKSKIQEKETVSKSVYITCNNCGSEQFRSANNLVCLNCKTSFAISNKLQPHQYSNKTATEIWWNKRNTLYPKYSNKRVTIITIVLILIIYALGSNVFVSSSDRNVVLINNNAIYISII